MLPIYRGRSARVRRMKKASMTYAKSFLRRCSVDRLRSHGYLDGPQGALTLEQALKR
jgi:hypothetical protein